MMNARERSRIETRRRLMETGLELFARQGVAATRASDIAHESGVAVGTLYLHFKDKEGLLRAVLFEGVESLLQSLRGLLDVPERDLEGAIRRHTEALVWFAEKNPAHCRVLFDPESVRTRISTEITDHLVATQEQRIRDSIKAGAVAVDLEPEVAARAIIGMIVQVLDWWTRDTGRMPAQKVVDTITRFRLCGMKTP